MCMWERVKPIRVFGWSVGEVKSSDRLSARIRVIRVKIQTLAPGILVCM